MRRVREPFGDHDLHKNRQPCGIFMMIATTCCVLHTCDGFNVPDIRNRDRWKVSVTMNQALARMRLKGLNPLVPSAFRVDKWSPYSHMD